jgi:predicted Zn-dependent protease
VRVIFDAVRYDGGTAAREQVSVTVTPSALRIERADGAEWWPYAELRQTQGDQAGEPLRFEFGSGEDPPAIVAADHELLDAIHSLATADLAGRFRRPRNTLRTVLLAAAGAIAVGASLYLWIIPALAAALASRVPLEWEQRLGRQVSAALTAAVPRCDDAAATAAVTAIVSRLHAAAPASRYSYDVTIVRSEVVNAFAAPGGFLVVHSGLLRRTSRPEELAGVLAHEIQHVELRHGTRSVIRSVPTRLALAAIAGDATALAGILDAAASLGTLRYQRSDETEADAAGLALLRAAGVDQSGLADFFRMLEREAGDVPASLAYLSTHPRTAARLARLESMAAAAPAPHEPLLPGTDWRAVAVRCSADSQPK